METYELSMTNEESKNYHNLFYRLKFLSIAEFLKVYVFTMINVVAIAGAVYVISEMTFAQVWMMSSVSAKLLVFMSIFLFNALRRSKNIQLSTLMQKYLKDEVPQAIMRGDIRLQKIKVRHDKIVLYVRRFENN